MYIYTLSSNNGLLSPEQRVFFEINGFLVIRNLINETLLDRFKYILSNWIYSKVYYSLKNYNIQINDLGVH